MRFFDYDLSKLLKKTFFVELNIMGTLLASKTRWRNLFRKNYGKYVNAKLVTKPGEQAMQLPYEEGPLGRLWVYFFPSFFTFS